MTEIKNGGRRKQDKENLKKQISYEDAKASRLTRKKLSVEEVKEMALTTRPTNDATFMFDATVLLWREKVKDMCTVKFWDELKHNNEFKEMWKLVRRSFIHIRDVAVKKLVTRNGKKVMPRMKRNHTYGGERKVTWKLEDNSNAKTPVWTNQASDEDKLSCFNWGMGGYDLYAENSMFRSITSKSKAKEFISEYLRLVKEATKLIWSFIKHDDKDSGFIDPSVKSDDIKFLFVRYVDDAFSGDVVDPAEKAAVEAYREVDKHYKYTLKDDDAVIELVDDGGDDGGDGECSDGEEV